MKRYLVGGAVRNRLLNIPIKEKDWVVVGSTAQEMIDSGYVKVGKDFPVFIHPESHEEYALARTERKTGRGYLGFDCHFSPDTTLEEDLRRRDITINAMAMDDSGRIIDPCGGRKDIERRWLRHVSSSFEDDPLRVMRVARFAAELSHLNFRIAPETAEMMRKMLPELRFITPERIWRETLVALRTHDPQVYFLVLKDCGALNVVMPELDVLFEESVQTRYQSEVNLRIHSTNTLARASKSSDDTCLRFASLCCNLAKIEIPEKTSDTDRAVVLVDNLCSRLRVANSVKEIVRLVVRHHIQFHTWEFMTPEDLLNLFDRIDVWRRPERLGHMMTILEADTLGHLLLGGENLCLRVGSLRELYRKIRDVDVREVIADGFRGKQVSEELRSRRLRVLSAVKRTSRDQLSQS